MIFCCYKDRRRLFFILMRIINMYIMDCLYINKWEFFLSFCNLCTMPMMHITVWFNHYSIVKLSIYFLYFVDRVHKVGRWFLFSLISSQHWISQLKYCSLHAASMDNSSEHPLKDHDLDSNYQIYLHWTGLYSTPIPDNKRCFWVVEERVLDHFQKPLKWVFT